VLAGRGVTVLNGAQPLLRVHDKLATARTLARAGLPHPKTRLVCPGRPFPALRPPVVVKPRFGSWGRDVVLCATEDALAATVNALGERPWFAVHGAIVQELVPPRGFDVRIVLVAGEMIGAIERRAAPGEWRTNVALGATRNPYVPDSKVSELAQAAAIASELDLVGVDLLPCDGGWVVLELNGARTSRGSTRREEIPSWLPSPRSREPPPCATSRRPCRQFRWPSRREAGRRP
jgi:RimK family alpha-L-glutamate ligase